MHKLFMAVAVSVLLTPGIGLPSTSFKGIPGGVWSTGASTTPVVLTTSDGTTLNGAIDDHYALIKIPAGCSGAPCQATHVPGDLFGPDAYVVFGPNGTYPLDGTWRVVNDQQSIWIGPRADQRDPTVGQTIFDRAEVFGSDTDFYVYRTTFNLTALGLDPAKASIQLSWLSDNDANVARTLFSHIRMCGVSAASDPVCPESRAVPNSGNAGQFATVMTPVSITDGFVPGLMALDFIVYNERLDTAHNASGLKVTIDSASAGSLPQVSVRVVGTGAGAVTSGPTGISCPTACAQGYLPGTSVTLTAVPAGTSVFTGWLGGTCGTALTCTVQVDGDVALTATFAAAGTIATLDIDRSAPNHKYDGLTDGLLVMRYLFGLTGNVLVTNALAPSATRQTPTAIIAFLDDIRPRLDVDGNGVVDALTDGLLIVRKLFGLTGAGLTNNAIGPGATRTTAEQIEAYLQGMMP